MSILQAEETLNVYLMETTGHREGDLASVVPQRYPAFVRVLNPAKSSDGRILRWSDIAGEALSVDGNTQWSDIAAISGLDLSEYYEPETGSIDRQLAHRLCEILAGHTEASDVMFLIWEGYSPLLEEVRKSPTVINSYLRTMHVRHGPLTSALEPIDADASTIAVNWLPADGSWFIGNDIYARSVYIGGSTAAIGAILGDPNIEAYWVRPGHTVNSED